MSANSGKQHGEFVADARRPVVARERVRQALEPLAQQVVDPLRGQRVGEFLRQRRVGAGQEAVVERLEGDAALGELALDVLVAVDAQPRGVREVRGELEEQRPEVVVDQVEVVVVDHRRGVHQLHVGAAARLVLPAHRAEHPALLLRLADEQHALAAGEAPQTLAHALVLALAALERHQLDGFEEWGSVLGDEVWARRSSTVAVQLGWRLAPCLAKAGCRFISPSPADGALPAVCGYFPADAAR